ncbi:MAG TPA: glycosyltransferase family 2 protein [Pirellula sp.]|nr:glycosyltransferase family 2 protein [Pirellula sp.]
MLRESQQPTAPLPHSAELINLSVVVPCFNEEDGLDQLVDRLKTLKSHFSERLDIEVVFVDDGSTDTTAEGLDNRFQQFPWARVIRHESNRGITAAILTGIENSTNELRDCLPRSDPAIRRRGPANL